MTIKMRIKEVRQKKAISFNELEKETGIERKRLEDIEDEKIPVDEILFVEMVVIAQALNCSVLELYQVGNLEIKGIGEF